MKSITEKINPKFVIQAQLLARYTTLLQQVLPIECLNHVKVANIRDQNLMLITDSPVWTTRLRLLSPQLLEYVKEKSAIPDPATGQPQIIHHIQISTRYQRAETDSMSKKQPFKNISRQLPHISNKTAVLLSQSASSISYRPLKESLLKIASHGDPKSDSSLTESSNSRADNNSDNSKR